MNTIIGRAYMHRHDLGRDREPVHPILARALTSVALHTIRLVATLCNFSVLGDLVQFIFNILV